MAEPMTGAELAETLATLQWSNRVLAAELACNEKLVRKWLADRVAVPAPVAVWLRGLARVHAARPAPEEWRPNPIR